MIIVVILWIAGAIAFLFGFTMLTAGDFTAPSFLAALPAFGVSLVLFGIGQIIHAIGRTANAAEASQKTLERIAASLGGRDR